MDKERYWTCNKWGLHACYLHNGSIHVFWFRIFGFGLNFSSRKKEEAYFSERNGFTKAWYIFGVRISFIRPIRWIK